MANELLPYCNAAGAIVGFGTAYTVLDECDGTTVTSTVYVNTNGVDQGNALPAGWELCSQCCPDYSVEIVCWTRAVSGSGLVTSEVALVKTIETDGSVTIKAFYLDGTTISPTPNFTELHNCPANGVSSLSVSGTTLTFVNEVGVSATIDLCTALEACGLTGGGVTDKVPVALADTATLATGAGSAVNLGANDTAGDGTNTYSFVSGTLPPGMTLGANGVLTGTPTTAGNYQFRYRITDADGDTAEANATIVVAADTTPNAVDDTLTVDACAAAAVDLTSNDTRGNAPASVTYVSGTVPPGMTFDNGSLSGTPTTPGVYTFTYRITDADGDQDTATVQITVTGTTAGCTTQVVGDNFAAGMGNFTEVYGGTFTNTGGAVQEGVGRHNTTIGSADMWAQVKMVWGSANPTDVYAGPNVRMSADGNNRYWMESTWANDSVTLYKLVNGVQTQLDEASVSVAAPGSAVFKLEVQGNVLKGYVDGVLVLGPVTDSSLSGPTYAGFTVTSQAGATAAIDDFAAGTCSGTTTTCSEATPAGKFTVNAKGNILDPCGNPWRPCGGGVTSKPRSNALTGFWDPTSDSGMDYGNGKGAIFAAAGWNCAEVMVPMPDPLAPFTLQESLEGASDLINEFTALGIVCIIYPLVDQGYDPASFSAIPTDAREAHDYIIANHNGNEYVWLESLGEAFSWMGPSGDGSGNQWPTVNSQYYNDAVAQGWTGMIVACIAGYGQGIDTMARSNIYDNWLVGKDRNRTVLGWHNFGSMPTVAEIDTTIAAIKNRNLPIICTSFGQNWADGDPSYGGDNPGNDAVGVDFTFQYGFSKYQTGGCAWLACGPLNTTNRYSWRYEYNNGAVARRYTDTREGWNEVGRGILAAGAQNNGGGASSRTCLTGGGGGGGGGGATTPKATNDSYSGTVGQAFSHSVGSNDTSGTTPSTWAVTAGSLPPGLSMSSAGVVAGTPTTAGSYSATYQITDANGATSSATVAITITAAALNGPVLTDDIGVEEFVIGTQRTFWPGWNDNLGVEPSTFAVASGSLPPGLGMDSDGYISGTPTTAGTYTITYTVTDSNGNTDTATCSIVIPTTGTGGGGGGTGGGGTGGGTGGCGTDYTTQFDVNGGAASNGLYDLPGSVHGATDPLQVSGGRARPSQLSQQYIDCAGLRDVGSADQFSETLLVINANYSTAYCGAIVRVANGAGGWQWAWFGVWNGDRSRVRLIFINNHAIMREYYWNQTITPGQSYRFRLEAVGNQYTCYVNGSQIGTVNDTSIAQIGDPGVMMAANGSISEVEADWLTVGSVC